MQESTKRKKNKETATSNTTSLVNDTDTATLVETLNTTAIGNDSESVMSVNI